MKAEGKFQSLPTVESIRKKNDRIKAIDLLEEAGLTKQKIDELQARLDEIKDELMMLQEDWQLEGMRNGKYCFSATWSEGRRSLSKDALVENGVDPEIIKESYRQGEGYWKKEVKVLEVE